MNVGAFRSNVKFSGEMGCPLPFYLFFKKFIYLFIYLFIYCCEPFLKVFIELVTILLLIYVLVSWPQGIRVLSSLTRD